MLLVAVAAVGPRDLLRRPLLWAGAAVALLLTAPTLVWQYANGWPQLRMASIVAGEAEALYGGRPGIAVQLLVYAGVAGMVLAYFLDPVADRLQRFGLSRTLATVIILAMVWLIVIDLTEILS